MSAGIDYGMGRTNVDKETGIRYGVISQHSVSQMWCDCAEADYGEPTYPNVQDEWPQYGTGCYDYVCLSCEHALDSQDCFSDEPRGWNYSGDGYELTDCLDSDIFVLRSKFYTIGQFCSPCVPGAVSLESPDEDGAKAYCLGHDWFEDGKAPYPVYSVETGKEVLP